MLFEIIFTTSINLWSGKKRFDNKYIILIVVTLLLSLCSPLLSLFLIYQNNYSNSLMKILGNALTYFVFGGVIFFHNLKEVKVYSIKNIGFMHLNLIFRYYRIIYHK